MDKVDIPTAPWQSCFEFPKWRFHSRRQKLFMSLLLPESPWMVSSSVEKAPERGEAEGLLQTYSCPTYLRDLKLCNASRSLLQNKPSKQS